MSFRHTVTITVYVMLENVWQYGSGLIHMGVVTHLYSWLTLVITSFWIGNYIIMCFRDFNITA